MSELRVALTFDAEHPSRAANDPDAPEAILDALGAADVRGTFFVQGRWASAYPDVARRMASDGHLIGNHSHYHARLSLLSPAGVRAGPARRASLEVYRPSLVALSAALYRARRLHALD